MTVTTTTVGIVMVLVLGAWHFHTRRHPNWRTSPDARFYITLGYPLVAVAVFFLANAIDNTDVGWAIGMAWALVSTSLFVYGFQALNGPAAQGPTTTTDRSPIPPVQRVPPTSAVSRPDVGA